MPLQLTSPSRTLYLRDCSLFLQQSRSPPILPLSQVLSLTFFHHPTVANSQPIVLPAVRRIHSAFFITSVLQSYDLTATTALSSRFSATVYSLVPRSYICCARILPKAAHLVASCSKCRYQYELVSGDICSIDSEATS
ncbi:hypothetical protein KSP39_PZI010402 [Platanthera zijinensis]|uniref:Uncharacterized protein n=1 Tax=Platanthera zijinensis TaxID=2320716 RepID=A0AAP0G6P2_9ASPA